MRVFSAGSIGRIKKFLFISLQLEIAQEAMAAGASDYIVKPFESKQILQVIKKSL